MAIDKQDPVQRMGDEVTGLWRQVGELVRGQSGIESRLDRIETDVALLKGDVSGPKTSTSSVKADVASWLERLDRLELTMERRFDRIDAQLERLTVLLLRRFETGC